MEPGLVLQRLTGCWLCVGLLVGGPLYTRERVGSGFARRARSRTAHGAEGGRGGGEGEEVASHGEGRKEQEDQCPVRVVEFDHIDVPSRGMASWKVPFALFALLPSCGALFHAS